MADLVKITAYQYRVHPRGGTATQILMLPYMKRIISSCAILAGILLLPNVAYTKTLTAEEIRGQLLGRTLCIKVRDGSDVCVIHSANGTSRVVVGPRQNGKWRFQGNKHCVTWEKIRSGKEGCITYSKQGSTYSASGQGRITFR